jgi:hypothetical protein
LLADWHRALAALRHVHPGLAVEVRQVQAGQAGRVLAESTVDVVLTVVVGVAEEVAVGGSSAGSAAAMAAPATARDFAVLNGFAVARHAVARAGADLADGTATQAPAPGDPATGPACLGDLASELVATPLPSEELVLATAPGGSRSAPADLSELSLVDFPPGWAIREAVDRAFPCRRLTLEVDDLAVAAGLVRAGLAACVLPALAASRFPDLTVRRFDRPPPWRLAAVHRGDPSPAVAALLAQLG